MVHYTIIDTETTGLVAPIRACEIAWLVVDSGLNVLDQQCHLTDPEQPIAGGAQDIHGISWESVKGLPNNAAICAMLPKPMVWIGHNCSYDQGVIAEHTQFVDDLCTLALSRRWIKGTKNHKLGTLQAELGLPQQKLHSALGDCLTTLELLKIILAKTGKTLEQLIDLERTPKMLHVMPFGMHRGKRFDQIPSGYRNWLLDQSDLSKDIRYTLERTQIL